jgi:hypothetical protein
MKTCAHLLQKRAAMRVLRLLALPAASVIVISCIANQDESERRTASTFTAHAQPIATITVIGADTLSDSARIYQLEPEPDGGSIAFLFTDPAKGVTQGLGVVQTSGSQQAQLGWPDSVVSVWWNGPHQLSFTAGTGRGVHVVIDAHAAELRTADVTGTTATPPAASQPGSSNSNQAAKSRAQAFIDSVRVQPEGTPQRSAMRYQADSVLVAPGDTLAAVHVSAADPNGSPVNPAWYLLHLPSGHVRPVDSLTGRSPGLPASGGRWGARNSFYYAKERTIWRVEPSSR